MPSDKDQIIALCQRLGRAHHDKNADAIADCYTPNAVVSGLAPPLTARGMDRVELAEWLETWTSPIEVDADIQDFRVEGSLAFLSGLNRMRGTKTDGEVVDIWFRSTLCLQKGDFGWRIVHDHSSVPFYMDGSFRAATDLLPA